MSTAVERAEQSLRLAEATERRFRRELIEAIEYTKVCREAFEDLRAHEDMGVKS